MNMQRSVYDCSKCCGGLELNYVNKKYSVEYQEEGLGKDFDRCNKENKFLFDHLINQAMKREIAEAYGGSLVIMAELVVLFLPLFL